MSRLAMRVAALVVSACAAGSAAAQPVSPADHAKHHPKDGAPVKPAPGQPGPGGMGMEGMGGMMEMMHGGRPPAREPFPEMMNTPKLNPEARVRLKAAGDERVREGTAIIAEGLERLSGAAEVEDWAGMQAALARIREGTARMDSGVAMRRVAAGQSEPQPAATDWLM